PFLLLIFADVQVELQYFRLVFRQYRLEVIDLVIPFRPDGLRHKIVNAHNQQILIVRSIENSVVGYFESSPAIALFSTTQHASSKSKTPSGSNRCGVFVFHHSAAAGLTDSRRFIATFVSTT